ncbi:hypothetical protein MIMGU_mgv11b020350mg [Erythranthe guttata]|uniref:Uncharacterized protein n=1 Tax=Erythranthe guttata TaxID=4155 RepID=A0A022QML2_ERYGU|nr:hypothetical protein MIMGU_mgv11b020350mg [Erythranthe guttata]
MGSLEGNEGYGRADYFLVGKDFPSYLDCQEKVDQAYRDQKLLYFGYAELDQDVDIEHGWFVKV